MTRVFATIMALGLPLGAAAAEPTIEQLLNATDDFARGDSSVATIEMSVKTSRYERTMRMTAWSKGTENTLVILEEPAKDRGTATLKVGENMWSYLPKIDKTMKLPSAMMSGSWMGSHFTNDDLVKSSRLSEDFTGEISAKPGQGSEHYVVTLVPKPDAPVVWGKLVTRVQADLIPVDVQYFDEKGALVRTMSFSDVRDFGGRMMPATSLLVPADKPEEFTRISYIQVDFETKVPDSRFSLQALKN